MEGELWKWTNYWNGWQPRWFILDRGILSYYKSLEEVEQGCKGSLNVSACQITLHPTDPLRLDLSIPGEQHIYVRAKTEKARQEWLVALGSAKACLSNQKASAASRGSSGAAFTSSSSVEAKVTELRMFCDMLTQQVHDIKANVSDAAAKKAGLDLEMLDENSCLLTQTCDSFIATLDEVMTMTHAPAVGKGSEIPVQNGIGGVSMAAGKVGSLERALPSMTTRQRGRGTSTGSTPSPTGTSSDDTRLIGRHKIDGFQTLFGANDQQEVHVKSSPATKDESPSDSIDLTSMKYSLPFQVEFPKRGRDDSISSGKFLKASSELMKIYDLLDPRAFAPLKTDVLGSLQCLRAKYDSDPEVFATVESIVRNELAEKKAFHVNSASMALFWLLKHLTFMDAFLSHFMNRTVDDKCDHESPYNSLDVCLARAYEETLMPHHGIVVRSVFSVAMKHAPTRDSFLVALHLPRHRNDVDSHRFFHSKIIPELMRYLHSMEECIGPTIALLKSCNIEPNSKTRS